MASPTAAPEPTAAKLPASSTSPPVRCFGDSPPEVVANDARPRDLFATGSEILWKSGGVMHRLDADTDRGSTFDASRLFFVKAADSHGVFGADNQLDVVTLDLSTGQSRIVAQSSSWPVGSATRNLPGVVRLWQAEYALDSDYLYVAWRPDPGVYNYYSQGDHVRSLKGPHDLGDLARVKRDGSSAPEYLGKGPDGRFVLLVGY